MSLIYKRDFDNYKLKISEFTNGEYFLKKISHMKFDVIILDIEMSKISRLKVTEEILSTDSSITMAFMTSYQ